MGVSEFFDKESESAETKKNCIFYFNSFFFFWGGGGGEREERGLGQGQ